MSIYAVVKNSFVINVIEWDGMTEYNPGDSLELILADGKTVAIGYTWSGENFTAPPEPITVQPSA